MSCTILTDSDYAIVDREIIEKLKILASQSNLKRSRLCLHQNLSDKVQEMVITVCRGSYIPPHRQLNKKKSYNVIEGRMMIFFFDERGNILRKIEMGLPGSDKPFIYRFSSSQWHTILPMTNSVTYLETISGPYNKKETQFAKWAPSSDNSKESIKTFINNLTFNK